MIAFARVASGNPGPGELEGSLVWLVDALARHHGSQVVVLVDEYDAPVGAGHRRGYRDEAVTFTRNWLADYVTTDDVEVPCGPALRARLGRRGG